jgi:tetratricopeptide (TPR) repeat protein
MQDLHQLFDEVMQNFDPRVAQILRPLLETLVRDQEEEAGMESGDISPTMAHWMVKAGQCMVQVLDLSNLDDEIKNLEVRQVEEPCKLLEIDATELTPARDSAKELLETLKRIRPQTARLYDSKTAALALMCIRFIQHIDSPKPDSYIAVSYRWPEDSVPCGTNGSSHVSHPQSGSRVVFPANFTPGLCKALLDERRSRNEGIWIDKLCINQECEEEKKNTIPAMDLIYKKARLTVAVLGDICLNTAEKTLLRKFVSMRAELGRGERLHNFARSLNQFLDNAGFPNSIGPSEGDLTRFSEWKRQFEEEYHKHPAFRSFLEKLLSAEWFTRAWCWHEFRMSRRSVYLVRCDSENEVLRFTDAFLHDLMSISLQHHLISYVDNDFVRSEVFKSLTRNWAREQDVSQPIQEESAKEPLSQAGRMIQSLHAGGNDKISKEDGIRDKLSITLNITGCGLYYKGPPLKMWQWFGEVGTLGLATGDPLPLLSSGPQLFADDEPSWLRIPADIDFPGVSGLRGIDNYPPLEARSSALPTPYSTGSFSSEDVSIDDSGKFRYISLSLVLLDSCRGPAGSDKDSGFTEPKAMEYAEWFINNWRGLDPSYESEIQESLTVVERILLRLYSKLLLSLETKNLYRDVLASCLVFGIEWMKNAYLPSHFGQFDREELENAYRLVFGSLDRNGPEQASALLQSDDGYKATTLLYFYILSLFVSGLPTGFVPRVENWEVRRLQSETGKRILLFVSKMTTSDAVKAAIPDRLLLDEYKGYFRVWLLVEHELDGTQCSRLLSKTRLIGEVPEFCSEILASGSKTHRKVYGATKEMLTPLGEWAADVGGAELHLLSGRSIRNVMASSAEDTSACVPANVSSYDNAQGRDNLENILGLELPSTLTIVNNHAEILRSQGKYDAAEKVHRQTLELRKKVLDPEHPDTLTSMNNLAETLRSQGKYGAAEEMHRRTLELREKVLDPEHPDTLTSVNNLAETLMNQGEYGAAEEMHRRTLELREKVLDPEHPDTLTSMNNLAEILRSQGKYEVAEKMHRRTLELRKKILGPERPDTLASMNNLALVFKMQGKYEAAEEMHRRTLELREKVLGPEHPDTLISMNNLAGALSSQGIYEAAEKMHRRTLELMEKTLGPEHPGTLTSMNNLAGVLSSQDKYEPAEEMHRRTLKLREKTLGPEHPDTLTSMNSLAIVLSSQGKYEVAEKVHRQTLELMEKTLGPEHPETLTSMIILAEILSSQSKYEVAEKMHRRTLELMEKVLGPEHPDTLTSMIAFVGIFSGQGKYEAAEKMHRRTLELMEKTLGPEHPDTLINRIMLAIILSGQDKYEAAEKVHRRTVELTENMLGPEHPATLTSKIILAVVLESQGKYEAAEEMHRRVLELIEKVLGPEHPGKYEAAEEIHRRTLEPMEKMLGPEHPATLISMNNLAEILRNQGKYEAAEEMHRRTLELRKKVLGPEHRDTLASTNNLAVVLDSQKISQSPRPPP